MRRAWGPDRHGARYAVCGARVHNDPSPLPFPLFLLIDLHSHLLPNLDDGSRSVAQSVAVLRAFADAGVTDVVLTPHTSVSALIANLDDEIEQRAEVLEILMSAVPAVPRLHLGLEIMLDRSPEPGMLTDRRLTLAGSRYALVEFRLGESPERAAELLEAARHPDVVLIVAHPERFWRCSVAHIAGWKHLGARLQLDATALTRNNPRGHRARELLRAGLADVVAADNHGGSRSVAGAFEYLSRRGQHEAARRLTVDNPRAVIEDREMMSLGRVAVGTRIGDILRGIMRRET